MLKATLAAQRRAALLSLDQVLSRQRALSVQHRFRVWTDTVIRRNSINRDRLQAAQMLARTLERNAIRRQRASWGQWVHVVDSARQQQADSGLFARLFLLVGDISGFYIYMCGMRVPMCSCFRPSACQYVDMICAFLGQCWRSFVKNLHRHRTCYAKRTCTWVVVEAE